MILSKTSLGFVAFSIALAMTGSAFAQPEPGQPPPAAPPAPTPATPPASTPPPTPNPADSPLPKQDDVARDLPASPELLAPLSWAELSGQNVSLAYESGLWGSWWEQGLRFGVPFGRHFAVNLRALYVSDTSTADDVPYTADVGGRLDFIGRSLPLFNVMRLYGGGGFQVFQPVFATKGRHTQIGGGGHFGFEFFHNPYYSFFLEVGGQGGKPSPGATVLAGMAFYPWTR
jgi:hypothetical protein